MSRPQLPPTRPRAHEEHKVRLTALERKTDRALDDQFRPEVSFSCWGEVYIGESPPYVARSVLFLVEVVAFLGTTSSSGSVTFRINRNGSAISSALSIAAGSLTLSPVRLEEPFTPDVDRLTVEVTSRGQGARGLTVITRFR